MEPEYPGLSTKMIPLLASVAIMEPTKPAPVSKLQCDVSGEHILVGVVEALEHFVSAADGLRADEILPTIFDGGDLEAQISIRDYLFHIAKAGLCSKECFIIALVYAERLLQKQDNFTLSRNNVHRFMLVSIMVASKILDDFYCRNVFYAKAGGMSVDAINDLELQMVFMLDFVLQVQPEEFALYRDSLRREDIRQHVPAVSTFSPKVSPPLSPIATPFEQGQLWMVSLPPPEHNQQQSLKLPIVTSQHPILCHSISPIQHNPIVQHQTLFHANSHGTTLVSHSQVQHYTHQHFSHGQPGHTVLGLYEEAPVVQSQWVHPPVSHWNAPHGVIGQAVPHIQHQHSGVLHEQNFSSQYVTHGAPGAHKYAVFGPSNYDYAHGFCRPTVLTSFQSQFCPTSVPIGWCA